MSFSSSSDDDKIFVNFNQDFSSLSVGTKTGYKLYDLKKLDKLDVIYGVEKADHFCIVERLFSSSLLAVVSLSSPRKLKIWHFKKNTEILEQSYQNTILAVKLNRQRLVVCLEESIFIHSISNLELLHTIKHIPRNPNGLMALSSNNQNCLLAYPAKNTAGEVNIFDAESLKNKLTIIAHDNPIASMTFDSQGAKIATASDRGTVIRVFDTTKGNCIYEFRRGYARCVEIHSLSFSSDSTFLCASSETETVHIFKLTECTPPQEEDLGDIVKGYMKKMFQSASVLTGVADIMNQWRSFATVKLPLIGSKTICAITNKPSSVVLVASTDGYLYVYDLNVNDGGDCTLIRQHRLIDEDGVGATESQQGSVQATSAGASATPIAID